MSRKIGIAVGVIILVAAFVVCLVPLKEVAYTVTIDYQDIETYYETEPYEVNTTEPLDYEVVTSYTKIVKVLYRDDFEIPGLERECDYGDPAPKGYVVVKNIDDAAGTFTIKFSFWAWDEFIPLFIPIKNYQKGERELYLKPGESGVAEFLAYRLDTYEDKKGGIKEFIDWDKFDPHKDKEEYTIYVLYEPGGWSWEYGVTGTKTVTKTEYRQVEKQRTVTKQRPETRYKKVTLLDYLLHY